MGCCWISSEDESRCGGEATIFSNLPLCEVHVEALRRKTESNKRHNAIQASKHHPLDAFPGWCYLALLPDGFIKIGYCNTRQLLTRRMAVLRRQYNAPVVLLGALRGGFVAEAVLHKKFFDYRVDGPGERFRYSPEIAEFIDSLT